MLQSIVEWVRQNPLRAAEGVRLLLIASAAFGLALTDNQQFGVLAVVSFIATEIAAWQTRKNQEPPAGTGGAA